MGLFVCFTVDPYKMYILLFNKLTLNQKSLEKVCCLFRLFAGDSITVGLELLMGIKQGKEFQRIRSW